MVSSSLDLRKRSGTATDRAGELICPACLAARSRPGFEVRGHSFRRCSACASLFLEAVPTQERLSALYEGEHYFLNPGYLSTGYFGYQDYLADRRHIEEKFAQVLGHLELVCPSGRLLDVGAGPGLLLGLARSRGWDVRGLDLNRWAADWARDHLGVDVQVGSLETAGFDPASFEAVTAMDVIEHVSDPDALIREAARVTKPGGALAVLTADAGSPTTRALGRRWPEAQRAEEHVVLFSVRGLSSLLARNSFTPVGWHWIGKRSSLGTLAGDLSPVAPRPARALQRLASGRRLAQRSFDFDPRAKFCIYARRTADTPGAASELEFATRRPPRLPKQVSAAVSEAIRTDLEHVAGAHRLVDWIYEQFGDLVGGRIAEVGAGIGTFSARILAGGADELLLIEPDPACASALEDRFGGRDPRVRIARERLPEAPVLANGEFDLIVCQNVLEHVDDDWASLRTMAKALRPGGQLVLVVPGHPRLFGSLDVSYGHRRRYTKTALRGMLEESGLEVADLYRFNLLGIAGWWAKGRRPGSRVGPRSMALYDSLLTLWRPVERLRRPPWGLSLVAHARRPVR